MFKKLKELLFGKPSVAEVVNDQITDAVTTPAPTLVEVAPQPHLEVVTGEKTPARKPRGPKSTKPAVAEGNTKGGKGAVKKSTVSKKPAAPKAPKKK